MAIGRFNRENFLLPISQAEFVKACLEFHKAAEQVFGTSCQIEIRLLNTPRIESNTYDGLGDALRKRDEETTLYATNDPATITREMWKKAMYALLDIRPLDEESAPPFAWAQMKLNKQESPRRLDFYIQSGISEDPQVLFLSGARDARIAGQNGPLRLMAP